MRALAYSVLFIAMFYIVGIVCEISGLKDGKAGIYMLVGIMVVLGFFIAGKNGKKYYGRIQEFYKCHGQSF